jgi:uncharacterized RDD family membrane protein YckC
LFTGCFHRALRQLRDPVKALARVIPIFRSQAPPAWPSLARLVARPPCHSPALSLAGLSLAGLSLAGLSLESAGRRADIARSAFSRPEQKTMTDGDFRGDFSRGAPNPPSAPGAPYIPPQALEGVRTRRMMAVGLDLILITGLSAAAFVGLLILSFSMSIFVLPPLFPLVAFFYNGLTVSGPRMATPGMAFMDLEMRTMQGEPVPFLQAAVHAVLFYVTWLLPPLLLVSFVTSDKRCLHDILADVIVLRRSV